MRITDLIKRRIWEWPDGLVWKISEKFIMKSIDQKYELFTSILNPVAEDKVLDVGVGPSNLKFKYWNFLERRYPWPENITAVAYENSQDYSDFRNVFPKVKLLFGDGKKLPFPDRHFNIVFTNAVVEHIGNREEQKRFIREVIRVGERIFITTPNYWFPVDTHTLIPFVHYLPLWIRFWIYRKAGRGYFANLDRLNLLKLNDFLSLFPEGVKVTLIKQKVFGLVSGFIAIVNKDKRVLPRISSRQIRTNFGGDKMKFSVPTNWQDDLIPNLDREGVYEVYGKLAADFIGGGRASFLIPPVSRKKAAAHIKEIHKRGLKFNYLLNTTCLGNLEWTSGGQRRIRKLLDWLVTTGVDSVTVAIPYLLEVVKKLYPSLKVNVSTQAGIDTLQRAKYWEDLGADKLTLSVVDVNRNFKLLQKIKKNVKCELELVANLLCLSGCPFYKYHSVLNAHASQLNFGLRGFFVDYCSLKCTSYRLTNPVEFIRSLWIRPEDISYYEKVGIDSIKLVDRGMNTKALSLIIAAYSRGSYEGNLFDLMPHPTKNIMFQESSLFHKARYFFRPFLINIFRFKKGESLFTGARIFIDNKKLEGFIKHFLNNDCSSQTCNECGYCQKFAEKALKVEPANQAERIENFLSELISGDMFRYTE